jgi:predicted DNA-binding transcriptional regulator AlpA
MQDARKSNLDELLGVNDVIELLGVSRQTLYNWRSLRQGPPGFKLNGGLLKFWRSDVEIWLEDQMTSEED